MLVNCIQKSLRKIFSWLALQEQVGETQNPYQTRADVERKGKTTLAKRIAAVTSLTHLEVGKFAEEHNCLGSYDEQLDCFEIEEEKVGFLAVFFQ